MHFDEKQYEQARQDGKKRLRPNAIPNLLKRHKTEEKKKEERDMAKKALYSNHIQDLESRKFYIILILEGSDADYLRCFL